MNNVNIENQPYNFPVELQPVFMRDGTAIKHSRAVVRTDEDLPLAVVSDRYNLITHKEVMDVINPYVNQFGSPETEYSMERDGSRLVALHTFRDRTIKVPGIGDKVALRVYTVNSYDSKSSVMMKVGAMVLKCLNGMVTQGDYMDIRFRHMGEQHIELPDPELLVRQFEKSEDRWGEWAATKVVSDKFLETRDLLFKTQVISQRAYTHIEPDAKRAENVWQLYNAYTYSLNHVQSRTRHFGRLNKLQKLDRVFAHVFESEGKAA